MDQDRFIIRNGMATTGLSICQATRKSSLTGFGLDHIDDVRAWAKRVGDNVVIRLDDDQALRLLNVHDLQAQNFWFVNVQQPVEESR